MLGRHLAQQRARHAVGEVGVEAGGMFHLALEEWPQPQKFRMDDGADAQSSADMAADSAGRVDRFARGVERALRRRQPLFPGVRQTHAARCAFEQHQAGLFAQVLERGLRQVQALRSARKIAFPRQGDKGSQDEAHDWILAPQISSTCISHRISPCHRVAMGNFFPNRKKRQT